MKRRFSSHMTLIELTLALFFLMLAMVTIIGLFTTAYSMSSEAGRLTRAVEIAQDCAALIEGSCCPKDTLSGNGYIVDEEAGAMMCSKDDLTVVVHMNEEQTSVGTLLTGTLSVEHGDECLLDWPVSRYINKEVIHP